MIILLILAQSTTFNVSIGYPIYIIEEETADREF